MAALNLRSSARALDQLDGILNCITLDNPEAAQRIAERAEQALGKLLKLAKLGPEVLPGLPHREVLAQPCRIIYKRKGNTLWVVAVLRTEQLLRPEWFSEEEP